MAAQLFELREFLEDNFPTIIKISSDTTALKQNYKQIINTMHFDVIRGLWRFEPLFKDAKLQNTMLTCRALQCIFEKFALIVWANTTKNIQENYYQGVTDILEIVFGAYVNFN